MTKVKLFEDDDWALGSIQLWEDEAYWYLYVGSRDLQISKSTKRISGAGYLLVEMKNIKKGDWEKAWLKKLRNFKKKGVKVQ